MADEREMVDVLMDDAWVGAKWLGDLAAGRVSRQEVEAHPERLVAAIFLCKAVLGIRGGAWGHEVGGQR